MCNLFSYTLYKGSIDHEKIDYLSVPPIFYQKRRSRCSRRRHSIRYIIANHITDKVIDYIYHEELESAIINGKKLTYEDV